MTLAVNSTQLYIAVRSFLNPTGPTQEVLLQYETADSQTANTAVRTTIVVPASTTGYQVNIPTLFPNAVLPLFVWLTDLTNPGLGFYFYSVSGDTNKQKIAANGFVCWTGDGATAPAAVYVDNTSATSALVLEVGLASN